MSVQRPFSWIGSTALVVVLIGGILLALASFAWGLFDSAHTYGWRTVLTWVGGFVAVYLLCRENDKRFDKLSAETEELRIRVYDLERRAKELS